MMVCCEFCGAGDDIENMFNATFTTSNGSESTMVVCEGCAHSNKNILNDVVAVSAINNALNCN